MTETSKIRPTTENLDDAIKIYEKFAGKAREMPRAAQRAVTAAAVDLLPESIQPYAKAELAVQYLSEAQNQENTGNHAAAKVYTAIAMQYLAESGIDMDAVLPKDEAKQKEIGEYVSNLFQAYKGGE